MRETSPWVWASQRRRPGHRTELLPVMPPDRRLPAARKRAAPVDRDAGAPAPVHTGVHPPCEARPPPAGRPGGAGRRPWRTPTGPTRAAPGPERRAHPRACLHKELYITLVTYANRVRRPVVKGEWPVMGTRDTGAGPDSSPQPEGTHPPSVTPAKAGVQSSNARRQGHPRRRLDNVVI